MTCLHATVGSSMGGRPKLKNPSIESKCTLTILTSKRNPASELAQPKRNGTKQPNLASKASPPTNMAHNLTKMHRILSNARLTLPLYLPCTYSLSIHIVELCITKEKAPPARGKVPVMMVPLRAWPRLQSRSVRQTPLLLS